MVLAALYLGQEELILVGAPSEVGQVVGISVIDTQVAGFTLLEVKYPYAGNLVVSTGHRIFDVFESGWSGVNIHQRIISHMGYIFFIEGDIVPFGRPKDSLLDPELIAMDGLSGDDIFIFGNCNREARFGLSSQEEVVIHGISHRSLRMVIGSVFCFFRQGDLEHRALYEVVIDIEMVGCFHHHLAAVHIYDVGIAFELVGLGKFRNIDTTYFFPLGVKDSDIPIFVVHVGFGARDPL